MTEEENCFKKRHAKSSTAILDSRRRHSLLNLSTARLEGIVHPLYQTCVQNIGTLMACEEEEEEQEKTEGARNKRSKTSVIFRERGMEEVGGDECTLVRAYTYVFLHRLGAVSYTHLTLPTRRTV